MKRTVRFLLFICISFFINEVYAQEAKTLFINMPDSLTPLLTATNKADFIDFLESNMKAEVKNKFDGTSEMTDLTADFIKINMTEHSTWQMKRLNAADDTVLIGVIYTACAPVCDSFIQFYTENWSEVSVSDYLKLPVLDDFIQTPVTDDLTDFNNLMLKVDMLLMQAEFSKDNNTLLFTFTTPRYLNSEDAEKLTPYVKSPVVYQWNNGSFIK